MDKLDTIINQKRRELAALKKVADDAIQRFHDSQLELSALERADALRPMPVVREITASVLELSLSANTKAADDKKRGGRKPGSISHNWRLVLANWICDGNELRTDKEICTRANPIVDLAITSVRQRIRSFCDQEYLEQIGERYRVTDLAIKKFGLSELLNEKTPAMATTGVLLNGAAAGTA